MISYTRNFEDVILQRVLRDVRDGCYVDVGASHPVVDSNTYAFYQNGWRGIGVEPMPYRPMWERERPQDIFINATAGEKQGERAFHIYEQFQQCSTCSDETVAHLQKSGKVPDQSITVPVFTLNDVLMRHLGDRSIHLMSIDVEGMEREVLLGLDLGKYRPWVMILEAVIPGSPVPCHEAWEPLIVDSGYSMVYFDGVNRFYLARERQELRERFALPPNVWDQFIKASEIENYKERAALEATVRQLSDQINAMKALGANES
jgi:FkbM family methyltransferase